MLWLCVVAGLALVVAIAIGARSTVRLPSDKMLEGQLRHFLSMKPIVPAGKYLLVYFDFDPGVLMGGLPDDPPRSMESYAAAVEQARVLTEKDDEVSIGIFDENQTFHSVVIWGVVYQFIPGKGGLERVEQDAVEGSP